jgi:hypothetical protein
LKRCISITIGALLLLTASEHVCRAADVLQHVPGDALGLVVIRDLAATDAKVQRLLNRIQLRSIGPLAFLRATTGIEDGLNTSGDFLLAVVPGNGGTARPKICIWLPIKDYDQLVRSLGGQPGRGITAISLAGEDLLIARQDEWALVMDPDQRSRMADMLAEAPMALDRMPSWNGWAGKNDITVAALPKGIQKILELSTMTSPPGRSSDAAARDQSTDDLFGPMNPRAAEGSGEIVDNRLESWLAAGLQRSVGALLTASPRFSQLAGSMQSLACGVRFDDAGNARAGLRASWPGDSIILQAPAQARSALPPTLFDKGEFVLHVAGTWPTALTSLAAGTYARLVVDELKSQEGIQLDDETVSRYVQAVEQAAAEVTSFNVLTLPGENHQGVYTNGFVVVRATSAEKFLDLASEVIRLWNQMNREAEGGPRLVFDVAELPVANRTTVQYSLDLAAADGAPAIPEMRQAMERLFGPGGKLTLLLVKVDEQTTLLAAATLHQLTEMLQRLDRRQPTDWSIEPFAGVNRLLPQQAAWRAYLSPHGYTTWSARRMDAIVGVPVIGGPLVKEFPRAPPIGAAGGVRENELWIDLGVPVETISGAGTYLQRLQARGRR